MQIKSNLPSLFGKTKLPALGKMKLPKLTESLKSKHAYTGKGFKAPKAVLGRPGNFKGYISKVF